jgi:DNA-binding response OmpR family regulator
MLGAIKDQVQYVEKQRTTRMRMAKILLVEDDSETADMVAAWLENEHYDVEIANDGKEGFERLVCFNYDAAILDWNLPGLTGPEICQKYREQNGNIPILMLTAREAIDEKETGYGAGADDYLTKPFEIKELSLRLHAMLRRSGGSVSETLKVGGLELNPRQFTLTRGGAPIILMPRDFALLEFFMRNPGQVFSVSELLRSVWKSDADAGANALRLSIKRLRQKIDVPGKPSIIETLTTVGYRINAQQ